MTRVMSVALICDLDDTLWSRREAIARWAAGLAHRFNKSNADTASLALELSLRDLLPWPSVLAHLHSSLELPVSLQSLNEWHTDTYPQCFRAFSGVAAALATLRQQGWRIAAASNGSSRRQRAKLRATGLTDCFDVLVFSDDVRSKKPERAFFEAVVMRVQPAQEIWVVGDSPVEDVKGGQMAGALTGWVSDGRSWPRDDPPPNLTARSFVELAALLEVPFRR